MASNSQVSNRNWKEQWVSNVIGFSSQYGTQSWAAKTIIGASSVYPSYGDSYQAWTPQGCNANEYIEVEFEEYIFIQSVHIYETYNAGGVKKILCKCSKTGSWVVLWETDQVEHIQECRIFSPNISKHKFSSNQLRIEVDCTVANDWCEYDAIKVAGRPKLIDPPPDDELNNDLEILINNKEYSDVIFEIDRMTVHAHKAILAARSSYFRKMFEGNKNKDKIKIQDIAVESFLGLIKYCYTNNLKEVNSLTLVDLIIVGEKIACESVKQLAFYDLLDLISDNNVIDIYLSIGSRKPTGLLAEVKQCCLEHIGQNMKEVSKTKKFCQLPQAQMLAIVQEATEVGKPK